MKRDTNRIEFPAGRRMRPSDREKMLVNQSLTRAVSALSSAVFDRWTADRADKTLGVIAARIARCGVSLELNRLVCVGEFVVRRAKPYWATENILQEDQIEFLLALSDDEITEQLNEVVLLEKRLLD